MLSKENNNLFLLPPSIFVNTMKNKYINIHPATQYMHRQNINKCVKNLKPNLSTAHTYLMNICYSCWYWGGKKQFIKKFTCSDNYQILLEKSSLVKFGGNIYICFPLYNTTFAHNFNKILFILATFFIHLVFHAVFHLFVQLLF